MVEIYQNCPIFNDGAFDAVKSPVTRDEAIIPLVHGEPIRFGGDGSKGLIRDAATGGVKVVPVGDAPDQVSPDEVLVHDAHNADATTAFAISRLTDAGRLHQAPIGIFRQVVRPTYDDLARDQIAEAAAGVSGTAPERLAGLIGGGRHLDRGLSESRRGLLLGVAAYLLWGAFPLYWPLLEPAGAFEILAHRIIWSLVVMGALVLALGRTTAFRRVLESRRVTRLLALAACLVTVNWATYIWAVNNGHVVESSLGYFINPLVTVLMGVLHPG